MTDLNGSATDIKISQLGECYLYAPDLIGRVTELDPDDEGQTRAAGGYQAGTLDAALDAADFTTEYLFEFEVEEDGAGVTASDTRSGGGEMTTRQGETAIMLTVQARRAGLGYVVLHTDEGGWSQWVWPESRADGLSFTQGDEVIFYLPRTSAPRPADTTEAGPDGTRGPFGRFGQRMVRVLTFATDPLVGKPALAYISTWEQAHRPYKILALGEGRFQRKVDWASMDGKRTLLLVHGTFSNAEATFAHLLPHIQPLADLYQGRVIAFNHPSLHHNLGQNIAHFLTLLPETIHLELDMITHSRGGLVGRELCEHLAGHQVGSRDISVRRAVFVAGPHQGTVLADGAQMMEMIDRYTNFLVALPDDALGLSLEGLLALVKIVGHAAVQILPGIQVMHPKGADLQRLNGPSQPTTAYYAIGANFTPHNPAWMKRLCLQSADKLVDKVFNGDNDLVVPTLGTYQGGHNAPAFPIPSERRRIYEAEAGLHHGNYFEDPEVRQQILTWLAA